MSGNQPIGDIHHKEVDLHSEHPAESDHHLDHDPHLKEYTPGQIRSIRIQGWLCLLGGILLHFVLGTFYLWGTISPYITAWMKEKNPDVTLAQMAVVFPILGLVQNACLSFGVKLAQKIGYKTICFLCGSCISLAFLICAFVQHQIGFIIVFCLLVGVPAGLVYMVPIICGWRFFPANKGLVSGLTIAGYGFGSFTFNFICLAIVNPNNEKPTNAVMEDGKIHKYFGPNVYENVPKMFLILAGCYFALTIVATCLIKFPRDLHLEYMQVNTKPSAGHDNHAHPPANPQKKLNECQSLQQGVKSRPFFILVPLVLASTMFGLLMANAYKYYGQEMGIDDRLLTIVGSVASASNGCSRAAWAMAMDKFGFKTIFFFNMIIQMGMCAGMGYVNGSFPAYLVLDAITMGCEGGLFSTFPVISTKIFGAKVGPIIYGFLFFCIGISNITAFLIYKFQVNVIGWQGLFWIFFGMKFFALILGLFVPENNYEWKQ